MQIILLLQTRKIQKVKQTKVALMQLPELPEIMAFTEEVSRVTQLSTMKMAVPMRFHTGQTEILLF